MSSDVLTVDRVSKRYGKRTALRDVTFRLRSGESVGYLGPNGAGKTTTLKLISGLSRPDSGSVEILGHDPRRERALAIAHLGAVVETPGVPPYLHGRDLLEYVSRTKSVSRADRARAVRRAADQLGVVDQLDRPYGSLSTGLARRLLLAAALVGDPSVLLLDEPTLGLDPVARSDLRIVLRNLAEQGTTLLLSTHLLEDVQEVCHRVLFLREGSLAGDEPVHRASATSSAGILRSVRLAFAADVPADAVHRLAGPGTRIVSEGPREVTVEFPGGDAEQAQVVARAVGAGLPVVSASAPTPDLARRYLEKVGREEAT